MQNEFTPLDWVVIASTEPWYHKWNKGNNPVLWAIRHTLLKLDYMGLICLKIGERFTFARIIKDK